MTRPRRYRPDPLHPDRREFGRRFDSITARGGVGMSLGMWAGRGDWAESRQEFRDGAGLKALHELRRIVDELSALRDDLAADLDRRPELDRPADAPNAHVAQRVRNADGGWDLVREFFVSDVDDLARWRRAIREAGEGRGQVVAAEWGVDVGTAVEFTLYEAGHVADEARSVAVASRASTTDDERQGAEQ